MRENFRVYAFYAFIVLVLSCSAYLLVVFPPIKEQGGVSPAEAQEVYDNLLKYTGIPSYQMPKLLVLTSNEENAYADAVNWQIAIYTGMLRRLNSKDELAAILGHEISHIMLQHYALNKDNDSDISMIHEGNADKFSVYLMLRAGYDICQARNVWNRFRLREGDYEINSDHPNFSYRYWQLSFPQCERGYA